MPFWPEMSFMILSSILITESQRSFRIKVDLKMVSQAKTGKSREGQSFCLHVTRAWSLSPWSWCEMGTGSKAHCWQSWIQVQKNIRYSFFFWWTCCEFQYLSIQYWIFKNSLLSWDLKEWIVFSSLTLCLHWLTISEFTNVPKQCLKGVSKCSNDLFWNKISIGSLSKYIQSQQHNQLSFLKAFFDWDMDGGFLVILFIEFKSDHSKNVGAQIIFFSVMCLIHVLACSERLQQLYNLAEKSKDAVDHLLRPDASRKEINTFWKSPETVAIIAEEDKLKSLVFAQMLQASA